MRRTGALLALIGLACCARGFWVIWHGSTVTQFVYLEVAALVLVGGGAYVWESGKK